MLYVKLFEITCIIVLITDISGIVDHIKQWISSFLTKGKYITKDFTLTIIDCSFCQNWWVCLIYLIITNNLSIFNILFILVCSFFTPVINGLFYLVKDFLTMIVNKTSNLWQR